MAYNQEVLNETQEIMQSLTSLYNDFNITLAVPAKFRLDGGVIEIVWDADNCEYVMKP